MSKSAFLKGYQNPLLDKLQTELRKKVEKQRGQLLILKNVDEVEKTIANVFPRKRIPKKDLLEALGLAKERALSIQKRYESLNKERFQIIKNRVPEFLPSDYVLGENCFVVGSFSYGINQVKKSFLDSLQSKKLLTKEQRTRLSKKLHKGHGVRGSAVSQVEIASAISVIEKEDIPLMQQAFQSWSQKAEIPKNIEEEVIKLFSEYSSIVDASGNLNTNYVSVVAFQSGKENSGIDAKREKAIKQGFKSFVENLDIVNLKGSSTLKEKIEKSIVVNLSKSKNVKVTYGSSKVKSAKMKTSEKVKSSTKASRLKKSKVSPGGRKPRSVKAKKSAFNIGHILGILNQQLPETVAGNMGSPALNYRTGRFANSVRATDISITNKGFPSIGYTYQLYPYQTFEPGFRQGSVDRDPRKLIDKSIREIMLSTGAGRIYTRRQG